MKNIYIGDIHGRDTWKQIVTEHQDADNIVFVGDYFDSFNIPGITQLNNAQEIVDFKKLQELNPQQKVYLLIGNHDHHYYPGVKERGGTSGFQPTMMTQFEAFFTDNKSQFQMAVNIGNRLCTHAGVSNQWLSDCDYWGHYDNEDNVVEFINDLFHHKPNEFSFWTACDRYLSVDISYYGNDDFQCPVWIRPKALQRVNKNTDLKKKYIQIVGHTTQETIDIKGKSTGGKYYYIDTLEAGQYLIDIDGEFSIGYIKGQE